MSQNNSIQIKTSQIKILGLLALALLSLFALGNVQAEATKQKVVYHINNDNPKYLAGALGNIQNHINAVGKDNLELRVVLHGNGLSLLLYPDALKNTKLQQANATEEMQAKISGLKDQGISFKICANTLKSKNIAETDLYDFSKADLVPSGVAELAILQGQGFAYVKP
ncbi:MAG: DsrE family protein [Gammaproteobacteria bacterium]|nr:DsrE family protein [Gammaproteobacteria bacterium]